MKKYISLFLVAIIISALIGCHIGGHAPYINVSQEESNLVSIERIVDENGRFADIIFPSGAVIRCTQDGTMQKDTKVTVTEQKVSANANSEKGTPSYIYNITAKTYSENQPSVAVNTLEKPLSISLPNYISDTGTGYIGIREDESSPWRYSLATNGVENIRLVRLSQKATKVCNFDLYRLGVKFGLFVFTDEKPEDTQIDSVTLPDDTKAAKKDGKYVEDLKVTISVSGLNLDSVKTAGLTARITYRTSNSNPSAPKVDGKAISLNSVIDGTIADSYEHSFVFELTDQNIESLMSGEGVFSFLLNL